jgi:predicted ATPase
MLKYLRIQNFKGWKDTNRIRTAPITLFFGANSSGKSSIGQFLMMLKQTAESPDRKAVFYPGGKNSAVQLGSYQEMVLHRDVKNQIVFEYHWDTADDILIRDPITGQKFTGNNIEFKAAVGVQEKSRNTAFVDTMNYTILNVDNDTSLKIRMKKKKNENQYKVESFNYKLIRNPGRVWEPRSLIRFYGFPDEVVQYYQNANFVQELNLRHEQLFRRFSYLGPLRIKAERLYSWAGTEPENVGYSGENTIAAILAARNRKISLGYKKAQRPFEEIIALKLKQMRLIDEFKVNQISDTRQEYEVKVQTKGSQDYVDLPDVGFGVSQVLPVLTQLFYAPPESIIIMEQPEIHLHPSAQSDLADVMIDAINSRENGRDRGIQLIIETHSEHFLRRLQRRIAEDAIAQDDVAAYFADTSVSPAKLEPLQIDEFGNIYNWPDNFFGDDMEDIAGQSNAALLKKMAKAKAASGKGLDNG